MTATAARRRGGRAASRFACLAALIAFGLLGGAVPAMAHATLLDSDPADGAVLPTAPSRVTLTFSEQVRLVGDAVHVFDATGQQLPSRAQSIDNKVVVSLPERMATGTYVVSWRVVSADSHPVSGSLSFSVGSPSARVVDVSRSRDGTALIAVQGVLQGLSYLGLFVSAGIAVFLALFLPTGSGLVRLRWRLRAIVVISGEVAVLAAVLLLPVTAAYQQGGGLRALARLQSWRIGLSSPSALVALLIAVGLGVAAGALTSRPLSRRRRWLVLAGVAVALASLPVVGHTRSYGPLPLVLAADLAHVAAGTVWLGGLLGLGLSLRTLARREEDAALALTRFSTAAAATLAVLSAAGAVLAWRILGSWSALVHSPFGILLLVKLGIVGSAVAVAAWNRYRLLPRLSTATVGTTAPVSTLLRRSIRAEAGLLVLVLALTGFLVHRSPEPVPATSDGGTSTRESVSTTIAGDIRVSVRVTPQAVGRNTVVVRLRDSTGEPVDPYEPPVVSLRLPQAGLALGAQPSTKTAPGAYRVEVLIPKPGTWEVQISVRISKFKNPVAVLRVPVAG